MADFSKFATLVARRFAELSQHELFVVDVDGDKMWEAYLAAFPAGSNPIYRERTEHDCSCCKNFIRNLGNVVAVIDGKLASVWGIQGADEPYAAVAGVLNYVVSSGQIIGLYRAAEPKYGADHTLEQLEGGGVQKWHHFHGTIAARHYAGKERDKIVGDYRTGAQVFLRGLVELKPEAFDTVIELIESKALYRGEEFLAAVNGFKLLQKLYFGYQTESQRASFVWLNATNAAARFRNTAIGTLLVDLSDGVDLEAAVKSFEAKVAPENYKRPTALITQRMVEDAMATINELGLEPALARRFARMSDITINNVLWADSSVKGKMKGGIEGLLMAATAAPKVNADKAEDIGVDDFMVKVLPTVTAMEVLFKNAHAGNLMTLTAPVHGEVEPLFKWGNNFGWSYNGNIADSAIKERVKKAGGSVEGDLCCRLSWDYTDDLDFHMKEPGGGHIYFGNRRRLSPNGGTLDLDANGADGIKKEPAENIFYRDRKVMRDGIYTLQVNNYSRRSDGVGFEVEIEFDGHVLNFHYDKVLRSMATVTVAQIEYKKGQFRIVESMPYAQRSQTIWGLTSEGFVKVNTLMLSPNHWDGNAVGNKHWFFVLDGCKTDEPMRGIYNEFLRGDLEQHRKVFEVLGSKTKCEPTHDQLSGLGFSSTRGDRVVVSVTTQQGRRLYNINF